MEQKKVVIHGKTFVPYITGEQIAEAVHLMAQQINADVKGKNPLFICIMNGAFMFASDLMQELDEPYEMTFARYSSYSGQQSTFELKEVMPADIAVKDRLVIVIEDLIDTGYTMQNLRAKFMAEGATDVRIATMLSKPKAIKCDVKLDYVGIEIENGFIVGHGLDFDDHGRMLKDIYIIEE